MTDEEQARVKEAFAVLIAQNMRLMGTLVRVVTEKKIVIWVESEFGDFAADLDLISGQNLNGEKLALTVGCAKDGDGFEASIMFFDDEGTPPPEITIAIGTGLYREIEQGAQ